MSNRLRMKAQIEQSILAFQWSVPCALAKVASIDAMVSLGKLPHVACRLLVGLKPVRSTGELVRQIAKELALKLTQTRVALIE